jgi:hypothetical protein
MRAAQIDRRILDESSGASRFRILRDALSARDRQASES